MKRLLGLTRRQRHLTPASLLVTLALSACGECVFDEAVTGEVRSRGAPVEGALITSCRASGWCGSATTTTCRTTRTNGDGTFLIDVEECRPRAFECELRPITVEFPGCLTTTLRPARGMSISIELDCR